MKMTQQLGVNGNLAGDKGVGGGESPSDEQLPLGLDVETLVGPQLVLYVVDPQPRAAQPSLNR